MSTSHSIQLQFILHYITLTSYYIVKDTFRWKVIKHNRSEKENNGIIKCQHHI